MTKCPPLPESMTLPEAAQAMTEQTGKVWTERHILGCAVLHEIQINARIGHAVRLVRSLPIEGGENELIGPKGFLPPLRAKAVRALLNTGEAEFDGWERPKKMDFYGETADFWMMEWQLAPGEIAPIVRFENCRVSADGVIELISRYTTPVQSPATPAPVVLAALVEPGKAGPKFSVSKAAMVRQHKHQWPTIERDMNDASANELASAKAGARGWNEADALAWARANNKLVNTSNSASLLAQSMNSMSSLSGRIHTLKS